MSHLSLHLSCKSILEHSFAFGVIHLVRYLGVHEVEEEKVEEKVEFEVTFVQCFE